MPVSVVGVLTATVGSETLPKEERTVCDLQLTAAGSKPPSAKGIHATNAPFLGCQMARDARLVEENWEATETDAFFDLPGVE